MIGASIATNTTATNHYRTIYVSTSGNDGNDGLSGATSKLTIQNAINTAKKGDTIFVKSGTYKENIKINKNITLIGENSHNTIIKGKYWKSCVDVIKCSATIQGFTITHGNPYIYGGGIYAEKSTLTIKNTIIKGNTAGYGGGIYNWKSSVTANNCTITKNQAKYEGGGIYNKEGKLRLTDCKIIKNKADNGGGIYNKEGKVTVLNSTIKENEANWPDKDVYGPIEYKS